MEMWWFWLDLGSLSPDYQTLWTVGSFGLRWSHAGTRIHVWRKDISVENKRKGKKKRMNIFQVKMQLNIKLYSDTVMCKHFNAPGQKNSELLLLLRVKINKLRYPQLLHRPCFTGIADFFRMLRKCHHCRRYCKHALTSGALDCMKQIPHHGT